MEFLFKKQINKAFWILRCAIGFTYIINGLNGLLTVYALNTPDLISILPKSGLTKATIISVIDLLIGILFFTPYLQVTVIAAIAWLIIKHAQSTYLFSIVGNQGLEYFKKTMNRIMLLAAILAFKWISEIRAQLKN